MTAIPGRSVAELRPFTRTAHLTPASIRKNMQEHKNRGGGGTQVAPKLIHVHAGLTCSIWGPPRPERTRGTTRTPNGFNTTPSATTATNFSVFPSQTTNTLLFSPREPQMTQSSSCLQKQKTKAKNKQLRTDSARRRKCRVQPQLSSSLSLCELHPRSCGQSSSRGLQPAAAGLPCDRHHTRKGALQFYT